MLTGKQKRHLRALAHHLTPIFQVGKGGVSDNMIQQISHALEARELIKVSVLQNADIEAEIVATQLGKGTKAEVAQVIGKTIVLYKQSKENKKIILP
ncbi:MAG: putative RNA-binding protein containing domain, ribosomal protein [Bacillales bacterium]|jgi:RNA-binding protein|nr:putative RNA-binding protein containing domain, ribosomal protein [Bacillales bacterium]